MVFFSLFLFFLGFTDAFAVTAVFPLPFLFIMSAFFLALFKAYRNKIELYSVATIISLPLIIFLMISFISFIMQINRIGFTGKGLNHTLSYLVIFVYFSLTIFCLIVYKVDLNSIYKMISYSLLIVSVFTIIEFVSKNFLGLDQFDSFIPRLSNSIDFKASYMIGAGAFIRSRGFTSESGHNALFLLSFLPFMMLSKIKHKLISIIVVIIALATTFSAAAMFEMVVAGLSVSLVKIILSRKTIRIKKSNLIIIYIGIIILILVVIFTNTLDYLLAYFNGIFNKINLDNSSSAGFRFSRWANSLSLVKNNYLFGAGPGISSIFLGTASTNLYIEMFVETGIVGLFFFLWFITQAVIKVFKLNNTTKYFYLFSIFVCIIHYFIIGNYWYPWLWVILAITQYTLLKENITKRGFRVD
ncbi:O-antigen ligase family protein [Levilactobacillus brevis]|uniref:O-antigen ligase family protein n=1 Tax=Levilactobacillus brevis TaxID=1580 RepID=UPI002270C076|nr:O-antigen ligase family protein [Levilactobacillus brevis]